MGGPIVRTGTTPEFWANWDQAFGNQGGKKSGVTKKTADKKSVKAGAAKKKTAKKKVNKKAAKSKK